MKIVQINSVPTGSTGSIMMNIHKQLLEDGHESYVVWGRGRKSQNEHEIYMNDKLGVYFHALYARLTGKTGFASKRVTKKLLKRLDKIKPDIIHLHNIHGYYINIELLFNYIKEKNIKVIWTLHDCWSFTGHCSHFDSAGCLKWQSKCIACPQKKEYPKTLIDNSEWCYNKKKELFMNVKDLTLVTPSKWLLELVSKSFLKEYNNFVINNGIDTSIFKKIDKEQLCFRKKYNIKDKIIILGVAAPFNKKKGYEDFIKLSKMLPDKYKIVMVGLTKKQIKQLPDNVLGIKRTNNVEELVDIYNSSDVFFNPTYEDNFPTVNIESLACGTPVLSYDTGGSVEFVKYLKNANINFIVKKTLIKQKFELVKEYIDKIINTNIEVKDVKELSEKTMINRYKELYERK